MPRYGRYEIPGPLDYEPAQRGYIEDDDPILIQRMEGLQSESPNRGRRLLDNGNVGSAQIVGPGQSVGLIKVVGDPRNPEPVTVFGQLALGQTLITGDDVSLKLKWGIENFTFEADVDLIKGIAIGLTCSALEVIAQNGNNSATSLRVGAAVGYGMRPAAAPPQRTIRPGDTVAPAGTGAAAEIPAFARGVYPLPLITTAGQYAADFVVRQKDAAGNILSEHPYIFSGTSGYLAAARIPIIKIADDVDIENVDAANSIKMSWLFDLSL